MKIINSSKIRFRKITKRLIIPDPDFKSPFKDPILPRHKMIKPGSYLIHKPSFKVLYESNMQFEPIKEPIYPTRLEQIGVQQIADSIFINYSSSFVEFDIKIWSQLIQEQREVLAAHVEHIMNKFTGYPLTESLKHSIKNEIYRHISILSNLENDVGEF